MIKTVVFLINRVYFHGKKRRVDTSEAKKKSLLASEISTLGDYLLMFTVKFHSCLKIKSQQERNFIFLFYIDERSCLE